MKLPPRLRDPKVIAAISTLVAATFLGQSAVDWVSSFLQALVTAFVVA